MLRRLSRPLALATAAASFAAHAHGRSLSSEPARLRPILFFGDLDGTVLGGEAALGAFAEYWRRVESPAGSILCYNTGRCITQYFEGFETGLAGMHLGRPLRGELPVPDVLITGDGTEVRWCVDTAAREPDFVLDDEWDALIRMSWWGSGLRERVLRHMGERDQGLIADLNAPSNNLHGGEARHAITLADEAQAATAPQHLCRLSLLWPLSAPPRRAGGARLPRAAAGAGRRLSPVHPGRLGRAQADAGGGHPCGGGQGQSRRARAQKAWLCASRVRRRRRLGQRRDDAGEWARLRPRRQRGRRARSRGRRTARAEPALPRRGGARRGLHRGHPALSQCHENRVTTGRELVLGPRRPLQP